MRMWLSRPVSWIEPTGLQLVKHINLADKGDYYEIDDRLPRKNRY